MKKIRFLKRTHNASPGELRFVQGRFARVLVLVGVAEYAIDHPVNEQVEACGTRSEEVAPEGKKSRSSSRRATPQEAGGR